MLSWKQRHCVKQAVETLASGGVIAYPTEGVWGLGCDPFNPDAVARILAMKHRPVEKGLILVASHQLQILPLIKSPITTSKPG